MEAAQDHMIYVIVVPIAEATISVAAMVSAMSRERFLKIQHLKHFISTDWGNNSNFGVGANNMLGFNNLPSLMNSGNFGNNSGGGGGGGSNNGGGGGGGSIGNNGNFGQNSGNFGNFGNDFGDFNNFGNNRNNNNGNNFGKWQIMSRLKNFRFPQESYHGGSIC